LTSSYDQRMTPAEQRQIFDFGYACYLEVVSLIIFTAAGGGAILGIFIAMRLLHIKTWREPKALQFLCCLIIVLAVTGTIIIQSMIVFTQAKLGLMYKVSNPPFNVVIGDDIEGFLSAVMIVVGDFVICWRAWVLLPQEKFWRSVLATILIGNTVANLADPIFGVFETDNQSNKSHIVVDWISLAFSLLANTTAIALIGWKAWTHYHTMRKLLVCRISRVQKTLLLFVESGALFLVLQLYSLMGKIMPSMQSFDMTSSLSMSLVSTIGQDLWVASAAIYPVAIIILIHSQNSPIEESFYIATQP